MQLGRNVSFHCMLFPANKGTRRLHRLKDFRGSDPGLPRHKGFIFHSETVIGKTRSRRCSARRLGLLHKSVRENASMCRQGIPDYLVTMRTPGDGRARKHTAEDYPVGHWQKVASPVWMDIDPSDTL